MKKDQIEDILCASVIISMVLILPLTFAMDYTMKTGNRELSLYLAMVLILVLLFMLVVIFLGVRMVKREGN